MALAFDAAVGYPPTLHKHIPHPIVGVGHLIFFFDQHWNRQEFTSGTRRALGVLALLIVAGGAALLGWIIQLALPASPWGELAFALLASVGIAQRSLYEHVRDVVVPLENGSLLNARRAVAQIVGRDTADLDSSGVAAAAIESLAESYSDGVVAPVFWLLLGGLPGLFAYKAVNTADSMIGHIEQRWRAFGWAAARTDDFLNLVPARVAGLFLALVAGGAGLRVMWHDARKHASPNAGWPEAAMAGALGVTLGGPASYDGAEHARPVFGAGLPPSILDVRRALKLYVKACALVWCLIGAAVIVR
jgi:adenosylcobinamide-phosphate synthase